MANLWGALRAWHGILARGPQGLARAYLEMLGSLARLTPVSLGRRVYNNAFGAGAFSSDLRFAPRTVSVGTGTTIRLIPHAGEFDGEALFCRQLAYEKGVFAWLERAVADYDVVVEIGANVGVYTVFLDKVAPPAMRIFAFEPAAEPYRRLVANLAANNANRVTAYPAAVAETSGFLPFFEPKGHLTNGSFVRDFAAIFSDQITETRVMACAAADLVSLVDQGARVLLKIDVEGYEPVLLAHLAPFLAAHRPDILIEVLPETVEAIGAFADAGYQALLIGETVERRERVVADPQHRDWLLKPGP